MLQIVVVVVVVVVVIVVVDDDVPPAFHVNALTHLNTTSRLKRANRYENDMFQTNTILEYENTVHFMKCIIESDSISRLFRFSVVGNFSPHTEKSNLLSLPTNLI